jgi:hypothetical protein
MSLSDPDNISMIRFVIHLTDPVAKTAFTQSFKTAHFENALTDQLFLVPYHKRFSNNSTEQLQPFLSDLPIRDNTLYSKV